MADRPFISKTVDGIYEELMEHVVDGIVTVNDEKITYATGTSEYVLSCGGDVVSGLLIEVDRLWGVSDDSFKQFVNGTDFNVDSLNNEVEFVTGHEPDDGTTFNVTYRYDQQVTTGLTDVSMGSVLGTLLRSAARQLASTWRSLELVKAAAYLDTATGDDLDELVTLVGVTRKVAVGATGYVSFFRTGSSGNSVVPLASVLHATRGDGVVLYETTNVATFRDGHTTVRAPIKAKNNYEGSKSNVAPNNVTKIISGGGVANRVNNPSYYSDYELHQLIDGKYSYNLNQNPKRLINTEGMVGVNPPWATTDNGVLLALNWYDTSPSTTNWSTSNVTLVEDPTASGEAKCSPSTTVSAYVSTTFVANLSTYPHVMAMLRGKSGVTFNLQVNGTTVGMYPFGSTSSSTTPTFTDGWKLYVGKHGSTLTSTSTFKLTFNTVDDAWVDFVGIGKELEEVTSVSPAGVNEVKVNYTAENFTLWYQDENNNFFETYDGDLSDGSVDYVFAYYKWNNFVSGGDEEETDSALRVRTQKALTMTVKGTKDAIRTAVLAIDGITECQVVDYNDDANIDPGICHVYVLSKGFTVSPALNQEILDAVNDTRAAGVYPLIYSPMVRYVNYTMNWVYDETVYTGSAGTGALNNLVESAVADFMSNAKINSPLQFSQMVGSVINSINGVYSGWVTWTDTVTPTISDDNYGGSYSYNTSLTKVDPKRISAEKENSTIVVQSGNAVTHAYYRMSDKL